MQIPSPSNYSFIEGLYYLKIRANLLSLRLIIEKPKNKIIIVKATHSLLRSEFKID